MKTCSKCKVQKDYSEFPKHRNAKDGFYCQCKPCKKEWKINNKDKVKEEKKRWNLNNKNKSEKQYIIKEKPKIIIGDKKTCSKCKIQKPFEEFSKDNSKKDKHFSLCKDCAKIYKKQYRKENQDVIKKYRRKLNKNERIKKEIPNCIRCGNKCVRSKSKYCSQECYKNDIKQFNQINFFKKKIAKKIKKWFKKKRVLKTIKTNEILGCTYDDFKLHLESKFQPWMNWDNYGLYNGELNYGWDIDHIIPLASAITEEDVIKLNHYTNLQPLCSKINRNIKRDRLDF